MGHDHPVGLAHRRRDGLPVIGTQCTQIDQFDADALLALDSLGRLQCAGHERTVSNHGQVFAFLHGFGLAERNHVVRAGIGRASEGLAIKPLMFQKHYRIVAANGRPQKAVGIESVRGEANAQSRNVREDAFTALRVIDRASREVAADRHAYYRRAGEISIGTPANGCQLVAELLHRGPDIVEELDFHHRLDPARGHADRAADNVGLGQGRVEDTVAAEFHLQAGCQLEDAAFAFDLLFLQILLAAAVRNIFAENHDPAVAPHLIFQADGDEVGHGLVAAFQPGLRLHGHGIEIFGINIPIDAVGGRQRGLFSAVRGVLKFFIHRLLELVEAVLVENAFADQEHLHARDGVFFRVFFALGFGTVEALIVRQRVRIRTNHMRVHHGRPFAGAAIFHRAFYRGVAGNGVGAVAFFDQQVGKAAHQL